jgi:hypothetical protein
MQNATLGWRFLLFVLFVLARSWLMCVGYDGATFLKVKSRECADVWFELVNDCFRLGAVSHRKLADRQLLVDFSHPQGLNRVGKKVVPRSGRRLVTPTHTFHCID